jgi:hypothetical protein
MWNTFRDSLASLVMLQDFGDSGSDWLYIVSNDCFRQFAILEDGRRWKQRNIVFVGNFRVRFSHVNFDECRFGDELVSHGLKLRLKGLAGASPVGCEVDNNDRGRGDEFFEVTVINKIERRTLLSATRE